MNDGSVAIVTPSYGPDFEFCRTLNRSVLEFLPPRVKHYIFVDRRDYQLFRPLQGPRTVVATKEEIMPKGVFQLPHTNRWLSKATLLPISGWLIQQIVKIRTAALLREDTLVMVDSDAIFVRDVDPQLFARDGKSRLFRSSRGITERMESHVTWHRNACRLLGLTPVDPPMDDYIGQVISWDRELVLQMCDRVESVASCNWHSALARTRRVSEYLLYGIFVERACGAHAPVWIDEQARCTMHWGTSPLVGSDSLEFARAIGDGDVALMIGSRSKTTHETRRAVIEMATNGRLR